MFRALGEHLQRQHGGEHRCYPVQRLVRSEGGSSTREEAAAPMIPEALLGISKPKLQATALEG